MVPGRWPEAPRSYVLVNDGRGGFRDMTAQVAPGLEKIGMVTDAAFSDLDGDGVEELVVVGEWLPVTVLKNQGGRLADATEAFFEKRQSGWWNKLLVADLDGDGRAELVVGNHGLNGQVRAGEGQPAELHYKDFDGNGSVDPVLSFYIQCGN